MKAKEKRVNRGYKATDADYIRAMKRAKKNNVPLASFIEAVVVGFGYGHDIEMDGELISSPVVSKKK
jgi:hypothetical protein